MKYHAILLSNNDTINNHRAQTGAFMPLDEHFLKMPPLITVAIEIYNLILIFPTKFLSDNV